MILEDVRRRLSAASEEFAVLGVRRLDVVGSVSRGEAGPTSDVDPLVDFDRPVGLLHFFVCSAASSDSSAAAWIS